jgi:uncharacterized RDD family membrane protein YckC
VAAPTDLVSGEGVAYNLSHAGLGSRIIAALIDLVIQFVALIVLFVIDAAVAGSSSTDSDGLAALFLVETVLVLAGYPIVMEWLTRGRTVGKLCLGLRVMRDDGGPIGFRQALVRGLAGLILEKPGLVAPVSTAVGMATMAASAQDKRIGDMMAGTFVLNERGGPARSMDARVFAVAPYLLPWAAALDLSRLDDRLALAIRQFVARAHELTPAAQYAVGEQLRGRALAVIAPAPPPNTPTPWLLTALIAERRRRADWTARAVAAPWSATGSYTAPTTPRTPPTPTGTGGFALPG